MRIGLSTLLLIVGTVAVASRIFGAAFRPMIDNWLDRLGKTIRVVIRDNRRATFVLPEGVTIGWAGMTSAKVHRHEFRVRNSTRAVLDDVAPRLRYAPYRTLEPGDELFVTALMVPTPAAAFSLEPGDEPGQRILRPVFLAADSSVHVRVFANMDGDVQLESACDRIGKVRREGDHVSETAQRVLPRWVLALRPIFLPLTALVLLLRRLGLSR